jgi:hypothetical protein
MNTIAKETHPVDDAEVTEEKVTDAKAAETKILTEDELKKFVATFRGVVSALMLGRENNYQADKAYESYLIFIQEEIKKLGNPVILGLFELQADIYKAVYMKRPGQI